MIDSVEILTAILGFSTTTSSKKVPSNDCDNDRQPEIAIRPPKPEILISLELCLKLNADKTELLWVGSRHKLATF